MATAKNTARPRARKVEKPGAEEVGKAPVTSAEINQTITEANQLEELKQADKPTIELNQVLAEESVERLPYDPRNPQIGDKWAGMVLTESGWVKAE